MRELSSVTILLRVGLVDGSVKEHCVELSAPETRLLDVVHRMFDSLRIMLARDRVLTMPGLPTHYASDKVMWVEMDSKDREDIEHRLSDRIIKRL
jgi:hypothetical protein